MSKIDYKDFCPLFGIKYGEQYWFGDPYIQLVHKMWDDYLMADDTLAEQLLESYQRLPTRIKV